MSGRIKCLLVVVGCMVLCTMSTLFAADSTISKQLDNRDCLKCHAQEVQDVKNNGARHLTEVTCQDCHQEHPPSGSNAIPLCSQCHDPQVKNHYTVDNCSNCHNPHYPLLMDISSAWLHLEKAWWYDKQSRELSEALIKHYVMNRLYTQAGKVFDTTLTNRE